MSNSRWTLPAPASPKILGDCVNCEQPALPYTGATTTADGKFRCGPCSTKLRESTKVQKKPALSRTGAGQRNYPEPPPVPGARWLQLGDQRLALVDAADFERANRKNWFLLAGHAIRRERWGGKVRHDYLQRFVLGIAPESEGENVEFIDHNPLNCRKSNLRVSKKTSQALD